MIEAFMVALVTATSCEYACPEVSRSVQPVRRSALARPVVVPGPVCGSSDRFAIGPEGYFEDSCEPVVLSGDVVFASGSSRLTAAAWPRLRAVAGSMIRNSESRHYVDGHTDAQGDKLSNYQLSLFRAAAVRDALIGLGVPGDRLVVRGFGEESPVASNNTAAGRLANRRVEILPAE